MLNKVTLNIGEDNEVICEVINASKLNLRFSSVVIPLYEDDNVISLTIGTGRLSLFDELIIPVDSKINSIYKIKKIEKLTDRSYIVYSSIPTKTNRFILPLLSNKAVTREYFLYDTFFENAYIGVDKNINLNIYTDYPLVLLYRYSESEIYRKFETRIRNHPFFLKTYDVNKHQVLFIFDVGEYAIDIELFKQGAYSQLSEQLKKKIMEFYGFLDGGTVHQILYRSPKLKEQLEIELGGFIKPTSELYSRPTLEEEIYYE